MPVKLFVRKVNDPVAQVSTTCFAVDESVTVLSLKQLIQEQFKLSPCLMRLTCNLHGTKVLLSEDWTLQFYGLRDGAQISLETIGNRDRPLVRQRSAALYGNYYQRLGVLGHTANEEPRESLSEQLIQCCKENKFAEFKQLLPSTEEALEAVIDGSNMSGWTCLHYTCFMGHATFTETLVNLHANANKETQDGWTPLMLACYQGHLDCVKVLLKHSMIQVNKTTERGSALHHAAHRGSVEVCKELLDHGASTTLQDNQGRIALEVTTQISILELIPKYTGCRQLAQIQAHTTEVPPPFCGELYYASYLIKHQVYLVIDMSELTLARFKGREQFLENRPASFSVPLTEIQHVARSKSHLGAKYGFTVVYPQGQSYYSAKYQELVDEWVHRILVAVQFCQSHKNPIPSCFPFRTNAPRLPEDGSTTPTLSSSLRSAVLSSSPDDEIDFNYDSRGQVSFSDFKIIEELGAGSFGRVYKVQRKGQSQLLAIKMLNKRMIMKQKQLQYAIHENEIMKALRHPFVVRLFHSFQTPKSLCFVMELCPNGDLAAHISERESFSEVDARFYAAELVLALEYIHSKDILYRDMKPDNVLIDKNGHIRLADFGIAKSLDSQIEVSKTFCGSPAYIAPELLSSSSSGKPGDVYGLGCLIFEMLTGKPPFFSYNAEELYESIQNKSIQYPPDLSKEALSLLKNTLNRDPKKRPTATALKSHPFFQSIDWTLLRQKKVVPPTLGTCWNQGEDSQEESRLYPLTIVEKDYSSQSSMEECFIDFY